MPLLVYKCPRCEKVTEHLEWSATPPYTRECSECGAVMERVPTAAAFVVNGFAARNGYAKESR